MPPLIVLSLICFSRRALGVLGGAAVHPLDLIRRHESGDWGAVTPEEWSENDRAVRDRHHGIASLYRFGPSLDLWVVTEADRSRTRILLPDEW